jgi:hypothetical protein
MRKSIIALAVGGLLAGSVFAVAPASAGTTVITKGTPERVVVVKKKPAVKKVVIHKSSKPKKKIIVARTNAPSRSQVAIIKKD